MNAPALRLVVNGDTRRTEMAAALARMNSPLGRRAREYVNGRVDRQEISRGTATRTRTVLSYLCESFGQRPVDRLSHKDIDRWRASRHYLSPATLRNDISTVRGFVRWLQRERHVRNDPMAYTKPPKVPRSVPRALTRDEVDQLWSVLPDDRARAIVALMLGCGLRRIEVLRLEVADWDRRDGTIRVLGKGGHQRTVPVPGFVADHLDSYLCTARLGPMIRTLDGTRGLAHSTLGRMMEKWMREAGIKTAAFDGRNCHSLRHTLASEVADVESDLRVLQEILGHQYLTSTQVYLRRTQLPKMREAMEAAAADMRTADTATTTY